MKFIKEIKFNKGFTVIEMVVAVGIFTILATMSMGAIYEVNKTNNVTRKLRSAMDNLSFAMEDMTRNIRLGSDYHCGGGDVSVSGDCSTSSFSYLLAIRGVENTDQGDENRIVYYIGQDTNGSYVIKKSLGISNNFDPNDPSLHTLTSAVDVQIDPNHSGFQVIGSSVPASNLVADTDGQARVIIRLSGTATYQDVTIPFNLETTVSKRQLDMGPIAP